MKYPCLLTLAGVAAVALTACVLPTPAPETTGASDFTTYCAVCHGPAGKGDGELAGELAKKPADLSGLAKRNNGEFPTTRVMAQIWGYAGAKAQGIMPNFGPLLEGEMVPYDGGDGIDTPTPIRLVELAEYLKTLQE